MLLLVVVVTTGTGEVEGRDVVLSIAGQGTNTKTRGKQETPPNNIKKNLTMPANHVSFTSVNNPPSHIFWTQTKVTQERQTQND